MSRMPSTGSGKKTRERTACMVLAPLLAGVLLLTWVLFGGRSFETTEELNAPGIKDIAVSDEDTAYPSSDVLRFSEPPGVVYVYVSVERFPADKDLNAHVERSARGSLLTRLLFTRATIKVVDDREDQLAPSEGGVSGVLKFAVRTESGEPLPAGNYDVALYLSGGNGEPAARKSFVVPY